MSDKSDSEAEPSPKKQKTSGDEAEAAEPKATPEKKQDEAADEDGEVKPAAGEDGKVCKGGEGAAEGGKDGEGKDAAGDGEGEGEGKDGEGRKRKLGDVKDDAEALVSKLMDKPLAKKADVRGRRLLGAMMGHLVSAKSRLKDEGLLDPSKRRAAEVKTGRAEQEKETQYLERRLEKHYTAMKNFIRTRAEPTIFYLPKKHTQKSQSRLDETRDAVEQKIKALKVHLRATSYDPLEEPKKEEYEEKNDDKAASGKPEDKKEEEKKAADSGTEDESAPEDKPDKADKSDAARAKAATPVEEPEAEHKELKSKSKSRSRSRSKSKAKAKSKPKSRSASAASSR